MEEHKKKGVKLSASVYPPKEPKEAKGRDPPRSNSLSMTSFEFSKLCSQKSDSVPIITNKSEERLRRVVELDRAAMSRGALTQSQMPFRFTPNAS